MTTVLFGMARYTLPFHRNRLAEIQQKLEYVRATQPSSKERLEYNTMFGTKVVPIVQTELRVC
jgi:uncharacterized protein YdhG (YjbR/CyaY superfamily)